MQKKIDYCFDKLEKPLGISICGKWEVPRPFMSKTFPFVKGVGNMELSIKKTDVGMKSYELSVEIPRRKSSIMSYKASLDTPGSSVNRRFSADFEVRMPARDQTQFHLQLDSPFKSASASASGSLTTRSDLIDGSLEIHAASSKVCTVRVTAPILETSSEMTYKPEVHISYSSYQPLKVEGSLSVSKGRKQQISFDMKSNKPSRKPLTLKGTIMKEGVLAVSKDAEWKLSSDVALKSPIVNLNVRSSTEKQSKHSHKVSSTFSVDYQTGNSRKESVKLSTNFQKSSSKISTVAQFETSQYPSTNFLLTWNMQGKLKESIKNDITFKYGRDQEHQYINILQSCRMYESQPNEFKVAVKAPQFDIDSNLDVSHDFEKNSKLHADIDLRYKQDKHVRTKLYLDKLSEKPLKLKMKAEVLTPYQRMVYQDELEETSHNSYRGNAAFEWREGKRTELQYKYQKLSDHSKLHHEIETSLRLPSSQSPIKNKASIEISSEKVGIEGRVSLNRRSEYSLKAQLNKRGASYVNWKVPKIEGNLKVVNDADKKAADLDMKSNLFRRPRHVTASATLGLGSQKKLETEVYFDIDRFPEKKLMFSSVFEKKPSKKYECSTKLQVLDKLQFEASASGDRSLYGRHETSIQTSLLKFQPVGFTLRHELRPSKASIVLRLSKNQRPKAELTFMGERLMNSRETELSTSASLKSLDNTFQTKKWSYKGTYSHPSRSAVSLKSNAKLEWSPSKVYECESSFDFQPNALITKAYLSTPHISYRKQSVALSVRRSDRLFASSASIEFADGKSMSISSETEIVPEESLTSSLAISSPFSAMRDLKASLSYENKRSHKSLKSTLDVNGSRKADVAFNLTSDRMTEIRGYLKTSFAPEISAYAKCENNKDSFKYELQLNKASRSIMSASLSKQTSNQDVSYALQSRIQEKPLLNIKIEKESSPSSIKHTMNAQGAFPEIAFTTEYSRKDKNSVNLGIKACLKNELNSCYSVKGYHKALMNEENYRYYRKLTIDVEKSAENSSPRNLASVNIVGSISDNDYRGKFIIDVQDKKVGYEVRLHRRENKQDHCSLDSHIFTPYSTIRVQANVLHNDRLIQSEFEIVPDATVPSRKLGFELKKETNGNEMNGYLKLFHPEMRHSVQITGNIQREGIIPVAGKLRLHYDSRGKDFVLEIVPEQGNRRQQENKLVTYKLYREDKSFEASVKLMKSVTRQISEYGYDWAYLNRQEQKQGKLYLKLSREANGMPRSIEIEFNTPRTATKLSSVMTWEARIPKGLVFNFLSNNENIFQLDVKAERDCLYFKEQLKSRPFMDHTVCLFKRDSQKTELFSAVTTYQSQPCLEFELEVDPSDHDFPSLKLSWDKRSFLSIKRDVEQLREVFSRYVSQEDLQKMERTAKFIASLYTELINDGIKKVQETLTQQWYTMKIYFVKAKEFVSSAWDNVSKYYPFDYLRREIIEPAYENVKCFVEKYVDLLSQYLDKNVRAMWESVIKQMLITVRECCPRGSICEGLPDALQGMEVEKMKRFVYSKARDMHRSIYQSLHISYIKECFERIVAVFQREMNRILTSFSEGEFPQMFLQYWERLKNFIYNEVKEKYQAFIDWIKRITRRFERDEDFQVLKSLVQDCMEKVWELTKKSESFIESVWEPMCQNLKEYPKKWMHDKMTVQKFSPKEGRIELQFKYPIESKHIQVAKNAYVSVKNKISSR